MSLSVITLKQIDLLKRYRCVHIDGSFSPYGGSVACLKYSDGKHNIIKLSPQEDAHATEYATFLELLKEIDGNLIGKQKKYKIEVITDCLSLYKDVYGEQLTSKEYLLEKILDLLENLNIDLIWRPRGRNKAGRILEQRINSLRGQRMTRNKYNQITYKSNKYPKY